MDLKQCSTNVILYKKDLCFLILLERPAEYKCNMKLETLGHEGLNRSNKVKGRLGITLKNERVFGYI